MSDSDIAPDYIPDPFDDEVAPSELPLPLPLALLAVGRRAPGGGRPAKPVSTVGPLIAVGEAYCM